MLELLLCSLRFERTMFLGLRYDTLEDDRDSKGDTVCS